MKSYTPKTSLAVQWLRHHAPSTGGMGSIPGSGTKTLHALWCSQKKKNGLRMTDFPPLASP